jgi:FkbM family methyltransferase
VHLGKYYSQAEEEKYFLEYFGDFKGRLLEIGAYHPEAFSNSRRLIMNGWKAILVEPDPKCFVTLAEYYQVFEKDSNVSVVNVAIAEHDGELDFWSNQGALATAYDLHYQRWKNVDANFTKIKVPCWTWKTFYKNYPGVYDLISIDAEGLDSLILHQMDLNQTQTRLICVEWNYDKEGIVNYLENEDYEPIFVSAENIIAKKREICW